LEKWFNGNGKSEKVNLVLRPTVLFSILLLVAAISVVVPAQAVRKEPVGGCFEVVGRDTDGVSHAASFYQKPAATRLAAAWIALGWTGVMINEC
jgi:hypothetical protein